MLEDDGRQGHEDEAAEQDEEQRGENADLRLADFPLLWGDKGTAWTKNNSRVQRRNVLMKPVGMRGKRTLVDWRGYECKLW